MIMYIDIPIVKYMFKGQESEVKKNRKVMM